MKAEFGTLTGLFLDYEDPHPSQISVYDIALGLSREMRFGGQTEGGTGYSVAAHSLACACAAGFDPELSKMMLLHDASEAYMKDIPSGLKRLLPDYKVIEERVQNVIWQWADIPLDRVAARYAEVKAIDERACRSEQHHFRRFITRHTIDTGDGGEMIPYVLWRDELQVRRQFVGMFFNLFGKEPRWHS